MRVEDPTVNILSYTPNMTRVIERGIRVCYKSEDKIGEGTDTHIISKIKDFKHFSTLEHSAITVQFTIDRGVSHELVRHRLAAFSQSSTRYCNYSKDKFGSEITVINPLGILWEADDPAYHTWMEAMENAERAYMSMIKAGATAQQARSVLPNSLKTEVQMTANAREWMHVLMARTDPAAHPQIRQVMCPLGWELAATWPVLFGEWAETQVAQPAKVTWDDVNALELDDAGKII